MKRIRLSIVMVAGLASLFCISKAWSEEALQPDNSAQNIRDKSGYSLTPMDQSQNPEDLRITRQIRQLLMEEGTLSSNAQNVKVITVNGTVTLRGPVDSQAEKSTIEMLVYKIAGEKKVNNLLEVRTSPNE